MLSLAYNHIANDHNPISRRRPITADYDDETCENCRFLAPDDTCGNPESVYYGRPAVGRGTNGEVLEANWCPKWAFAEGQTT